MLKTKTKAIDCLYGFKHILEINGGKSPRNPLPLRTLTTPLRHLVPSSHKKIMSLINRQINSCLKGDFFFVYISRLIPSVPP